MNQAETLRLAARYALHLLYRDQHDRCAMSEVLASADYGNLWELLRAGLGGFDPQPQVPLSEIIASVKQRLGAEIQKPREITLDEVWERR